LSVHHVGDVILTRRQAGYPFEPGCQRHDFGYRNYKAQGRFTDANKLRIDDNFLAECVSPSKQTPAYLLTG
jgi:hypothetical protein